MGFVQKKKLQLTEVQQYENKIFVQSSTFGMNCNNELVVCYIYFIFFTVYLSIKTSEESCR